MKSLTTTTCIIISIVALIPIQIINGFNTRFINERRQIMPRGVRRLTKPIPFLSSSSSLSTRRGAAHGRYATELHFWKKLFPDKKESSTETSEPEVDEDEIVDEVVGGGDGGKNETDKTPFFATMMVEQKDIAVMEEKEAVVEKEAVAEKEATAEKDAAAEKEAAAEKDNEILKTDGESVTSATTVEETVSGDSPSVDVVEKGTATSEDVTEKAEETTTVASETTETPSATTTTTTTSTATTQDATSKSTETESPPPSPPAAPAPAVDPVVAEAMALKKQAEKARLEAEKMDAVLTLEKIANLEKKLERNSVSKDPEKAADLRSQIALLRRKLDGPPPSPAPAPGGVAVTVSMAEKEDFDDMEEDLPAELTPAQLKEKVDGFLSTPKFLRILTAKAAGFEDDSNATAVVLKMYEDERGFISAQKKVARGDRLIGDGVFKDEDLEREVEKFEKLPKGFRDLTAKFLGFEDGATNSTALLLAMREKEMSERRDRGETMDKSSSSSGSSSGGGLSGLFGDGGNEISDTDRMMESLFPRTTRKEDETPTLAKVQLFSSQVLTKDSGFTVTDAPEAVPGGFLIRGRSKYDTAEELMAKLQPLYEKSGVKESLDFFYVNDPSPVTEEQMMSGDRPPVIFVTSSDVTRPANLLLSLVTAFGIGGISFLSVYPFALDDAIAKRVEDELALNSGADLAWFSDLTAPIFFSYLAIQLAHEVGHWIVAKSYGFDITVPTWVPSPTLGITGSVTSLKKSPPNKQALLDFALAGPLLGMLLSAALMVTGLQLTLNMDSEAFRALPQLPVAFLYQSSLGGGIVEAVLGRGVLDVSDPITSTIHLHPFTIAGLASLLVNALALLPFGRTDGGRISTALLGRTGGQLVSLICAAVLLITGLFFSDALLFYFSFVLFFESELEIPLKNEVDDVDFSRVIAATATAVLVLLTVIPIV